MHFQLLQFILHSKVDYLCNKCEKSIILFFILSQLFTAYILSCFFRVTPLLLQFRFFHFLYNDYKDSDYFLICLLFI